MFHLKSVNRRTWNSYVTVFLRRENLITIQFIAKCPSLKMNLKVLIIRRHSLLLSTVTLNHIFSKCPVLISHPKSSGYFTRLDCMEWLANGWSGSAYWVQIDWFHTFQCGGWSHWLLSHLRKEEGTYRATSITSSMQLTILGLLFSSL